MKPRQTDGSTAEYQSILSEIDAFLESRNGMSICDLKTEYPEYGALIAEIKASGDKHPNICFSTEEAWARRADLRARVVQVLTNVGILQPVAEVQAVPEAIAVTPAASPSMLSNRLKAFVMATIHKTVTRKLIHSYPPKAVTLIPLK